MRRYAHRITRGDAGLKSKNLNIIWIRIREKRVRNFKLRSEYTVAEVFFNSTLNMLRHTLGMNEAEWISFWRANLLKSSDQLLLYRYRRQAHLIFRFTVYTRKKWEHSAIHWISLHHFDRGKKARIMSYRYIWK